MEPHPHLSFQRFLVDRSADSPHEPAWDLPSWWCFDQSCKANASSFQGVPKYVGVLPATLVGMVSYDMISLQSVRIVPSYEGKFLAVSMHDRRIQVIFVIMLHLFEPQIEHGRVIEEQNLLMNLTGWWFEPSEKY